MTDEELRQLIESNARAIQANSEQARQTDAKLDRLAEQTDANLNRLAEQTDAKLDRLAEQTDAKLDRLAEQTDAKLNRLAEIVLGNHQAIDAAEQQLRTSIDDTVAMIADLARQQQETDQRFTVFLEDARADRQCSAEQLAANDTEHRAFQQITQTLLAEISRIWQRLAG